MTEPTTDQLRYSILPIQRTGMRGKCPRCGQGRLFSGYLQTAPHCTICKLEYGFIDSGDGPAVFVIFIVGAVSVVGVLLSEILFRPPIWLNLTIWIPLTIGLCLGLLRPLKGLLIAQQYRTKAAEGMLEKSKNTGINE